MKRLSDYTDAEAIEVWADIFDPVSTIVSDEKVKKYTTGKKADFAKACKVIMKEHPKEILFILSRIDDEPVNGANALPKITSLLVELLTGDKSKDFFNSASQKKDGESSGSGTENTEDGEN